ncbi:ATP-binding protein [Qipengyuania gelatinilytica]|uniref:histidine kinase n=1 Tax=Qipengyuania gelatinilytica TaxID=2867231 RepID=A0ABX9A4R4_9SPHN|nr:MASE1 domain-containing protein [Qipengyuania gelatinilytica]QZD96270.1 MASE1 domain-containing protein [Qipengyuania gelatinilytica]
MATSAAGLDHAAARSANGLRPAAARLAYPLIALLAFAALAYVSIDLTRGEGRIAVVWLPNALAVAFLLRRKVPHEPALFIAMFLGNVLANFIVGDAVLTAAALALANSAEIWLAVALVRRWCGNRPDMSDTYDLSRFILAAGLIAPIASAAIASLALAGTSGLSLAPILRWATSDALSMLILAPGALVLQDAIANIRMPTVREVVEWLLLTIGGTTLTLVVFYQTALPLLFLIPPIVIAHAFRLGALGTAFSVMKVAVIALIFTQAGRGPINLLPAPVDVQILMLEAFLATSMLVGLPVAAVLATRDKVSAELAAGKKQMALLADNITDAILRYDIDGRCTYASPSVENVLGLPPASFIGRASSERVHPDAQAAVRDVEEALLTGKKDKERFTYRRYLDAVDGSAVFIEADCAVAYNGETGEREGIIVSARDVTNRIELERKLKRATAHAENAARAKSQFLANMSHEIRTPMNGVLGFADLLSRMKLDPEAARYADLIVRSGRSMMMLLNDILDISKIESGKLVVTNETFDLLQLVADCERLHKSSAEAKGVRLTAVCLPDVPRLVRSDPLRLRQILLNLLGNAVKFTERGEVALKVGYEHGELILTVEDSGIGIAPDRLTNIFDPFVQEQASTTRRYGGTGLGLSISRQLAELLGGSLEATSTPDFGSRFTLRLPFEAGDVERDTVDEHSRRASDGPMPTSGRILLAEDHDVNRMLVTAMLEELGQRVDTAHDGIQAVEAVIDASERSEPYDLVLMDIQMPECDGYTAARRIRRAGLDAHGLPIVALTANAFPEDIAAAVEAGMQAHLAKPLVFEELAEALARWMPVHIVDEGAVASAARATLTPSNAMEQRWSERKGEAMEAVGSALRDNALEGAHIEELARTVHKLAGSAGMFGEVELGEKAAALERALRASVETGVRRQLAQELLDLA